MKAIIINNAKIKYAEVKNPIIKNPSEAIIDVMAAGLCGSDIQYIKKFLRQKSGNLILGHEIIGKIKNLIGGKSNRNLKIGDIVIVSPIFGCKKCNFCKNGDIQHCKNSISIGKKINGGFAEKLLIPDTKNLYKIPKKHFSYELTLADPLAVCIHTLNLIGKIKNKKIGVIGDGTMGEVFARLATSKGAKKIIIFGKNKKTHKSNFIKRLSYVNISDVINDDKYNDFDIMVECVGGEKNKALDLAIKMTRPKGIIVVIGAYKEGFLLSLNARRLFSKEITLLGSNSYCQTNKKNDFLNAVNTIKYKKLDLRNIITHKIPLNNFARGIRLFKNKKESKAQKIIFLNRNYFKKYQAHKNKK